ncbi:unnamed protein product, partial [Soboliphyme baturini]
MITVTKLLRHLKGSIVSSHFLEEQRKRLKKAKEELEKWLQQNDKVTSLTRYRKADQMFKDEKAWTSVPDIDRREIFKDVIFFLEKKEKEEARVMRKRNIKSFADILDGVPQIIYSTTWEEARMILSENPAFRSDKDLQSKAHDQL